MSQSQLLDFDEDVAHRRDRRDTIDILGEDFKLNPMYDSSHNSRSPNQFDRHNRQSGTINSGVSFNDSRTYTERQLPSSESPNTIN